MAAPAAAVAQSANGPDLVSVIRFAGDGSGAHDAVSDAVLAMIGRANDDHALQKDISDARRNGWRNGRSVDSREIFEMLGNGRSIATMTPAGAALTERRSDKPTRAAPSRRLGRTTVTRDATVRRIRLCIPREFAEDEFAPSVPDCLLHLRLA